LKVQEGEASPEQQVDGKDWKRQSYCSTLMARTWHVAGNEPISFISSYMVGSQEQEAGNPCLFGAG
jgi:hypothetical protein